MKVLILLLSLLVFGASGYFFVKDLTYATEINYLIYMSLLVVLMLICIVGILISLPLILRQRNKVKHLIYNSYSNKRIKNDNFDRNFKMYKV